MDVFNLLATLTLDKSEYDAGLDEGKSKAADFGSQIGQALSTGGKIAGGAIAAVGSAAVAAGGALVKAAGDTAAYGDTIDKASQKLGLSTDAYQEWDAILQHSGSSISAMQVSMRALASAAESGSEAFDKLGLSQEDVANMSREDLFAATIKGLQNVEDENERAALASDLLGRSSMELGALLNTSAEDTEAMRQRVHELGGVMSEDAVKASAKYQDSLQDMQTAFSGLSRSMLTEFLPGISSVMDGITEIFSGNTDEGLAMVTEGIQSVIDGISEKLPEFMDTGAQIINALLTAIVSNLPTLLSGAAGMVMQIAEGLLENLPLIIETGLEVIIALADGIAENLPELLPTIIEVVIQIVATLIENAPKMLEAAAKLIGKLLEGVANTFALIVQKGGELVGKIVEGISNKFTDIVNTGKKIIEKVKEGVSQVIENAKTWGKDLIQNFIDGILQMWENLKATVSKVAGVIGDFLGFSEPDEGPLSNFHTFAPDMMELYAQGIRENKWRVLDEVDKLAGDMAISTSVQPRVQASGQRYGGGYALARPQVINVQVDGRTIATTNQRYSRNLAAAMAQ